MSAPETTIHPQSSRPPKPGPRPPLPPKPTDGTPDTLSHERGSIARDSGKVKSIINKFSQLETSAAAGHIANGNGSKKSPKRAPTIKPKPRALRIPQTRGDQAPPLPMKRSHILRKEREEGKREAPGGGEESTATPVTVEVGRSDVPEEEESIYEATLPVVTTPLRWTSQDVGAKMLPVIQINKPPRPQRPKELSLGSKGADEPPPAIPPRVPLNPSDKARTMRPAPVPGGIALPQLSLEGRRSLRSSPMLPASEHSPPTSPRLPHRAAPLPPSKAGQIGRSLSSHSTQFLPLLVKEQDEDGGSDGGKVQTEGERAPMALPRRKSIDWESRLEYEPLYQIYRDTVITKEIQRMEHGHRRGVTATGGLRVNTPVPTQSTLWQDLPAVRESCILETLSPEQCKYQESMFEVLTSEVSYLRSLRVLTEHFLESRELHDTLLVRDKKTLFSNILRIREVSERFLNDLEERMEESVAISDICDVIHYHSQHNFPAYIDYVRNQIYQDKTYSSLIATNRPFAAVITRLQESPKCQRLPFISFLLLPFQRITRIKMLIENILKRTKEGTPEEQTASKALDSVSKIIEECNTQVGKFKRVEELIEINKTLEFDKLKAVPIISQTRFLEKRGKLQEMAKGATIFNLRPKFTSVFLFLFNDLLVLTSKKSSERFVVLDHAHRSLVQVQPMESDPGLDNCFCLTLLENHQGRMIERLLKAPTQSDLTRWVAAFPNPNDSDRDVEEVIYEDWDCPQVQCVEQYVAHQADELNLELTEIINVVRKTNEGWYEGIRLSDGQKGWFPVANVLEITNEHVRRRNLRERYRVIQAASIVTNKTRTIP